MRALTVDEVAHLTPEQRWFLDWMSWCLQAQDRVAHGYDPSIEEAAYFQHQVETQEKRDRMMDMARDEGDRECE